MEDMGGSYNIVGLPKANFFALDTRGEWSSYPWKGDTLPMHHVEQLLLLSLLVGCFSWEGKHGWKSALFLSKPPQFRRALLGCP